MDEEGQTIVINPPEPEPVNEPDVIEVINAPTIIIETPEPEPISEEVTPSWAMQLMERITSLETQVSGMNSSLEVIPEAIVETAEVIIDKPLNEGGDHPEESQVNTQSKRRGTIF